MNKLDFQDLRFTVLRLPKVLREVMMKDEWKDSIFVGGGFIRSTISNEPVNDIDVFVRSKDKALILAKELAGKISSIYETENAYTIKCSPTIQIIHRWVFDKPEDVSNSFDFTICCAVIFFSNKEFDSYCDQRFYMDMAGKRLVYRNPVRNEDAGGSMLRVLKYYQKGFRIPLDSLGDVIARLINNIDFQKIGPNNDEKVAKVITGLLREVDPNVDPTHTAHLPSKEDRVEEIMELLN